MDISPSLEVFDTVLKTSKRDAVKKTVSAEETRTFVLNWDKMYFMDGALSYSMCVTEIRDAWPEMRQHKFFDNVTADHLEDIMASPPPQEKSLRLGFTGHISSETHVSWYRFAMHVNEQEISSRDETP
ncbi:hypothetical protein Tco_0788406 [Tanacetum coccineum]